MSTQAERVLVVDDVPDNLFLLQTILESEGFMVDVALSGEVALSKIQTSLPDLILLDVMMPGMNGYEVVQRIRQDDRLGPVPILLITAYDDANVIHGLEIGANDFIRKPIDFTELLSRIRAHLSADQGVEASNSMQMTHQSLRTRQHSSF